MFIKIRFIESKDWKSIKEIYNEWRTEKTYSVPDGILSDLQSKKKTLALVTEGFNLVAEIDGVVVGLIESNIGKLPKNKHTLYINQMNVLKKHRKKGIAQKLVNNIISLAKKKKIKVIFLHVVSINEPAIKLYSKLGFIKTGFIKNEYKFGSRFIDNDIMCKLLL
jgi:ribosomal protein S18 acetylase RimI-like enzyme